MSHQNQILLKIKRMEFSQAPSDIQAIHDKHCNTGFYIMLAAHGNALRIQQRIADNQRGKYLARFRVAHRLIIISQPGQLILLHKSIQRHRGSCRLIQIFIRQFLRQRIAFRIRHIKFFFDQGNTLLNTLIRNPIILPNQFARLQHLNMYTESRRQCCRICVHIVHCFHHMTDDAKPSAFQVVQHLGDIAPISQFTLHLRIVVQRTNNYILNLSPHTHSHTGEFRHRTDIVVLQLHKCIGPVIIQMIQRLTSQQNNRSICQLQDRGKHRGRGISNHVADQQIEVAAFHLAGGFKCFGIGIHHTEINDCNIIFFNHFHGFLMKNHHAVQQPFKLLPISRMSHRKESDSCLSFFQSFYHSLFLLPEYRGIAYEVIKRSGKSAAVIS